MMIPSHSPALFHLESGSLPNGFPYKIKYRLTPADSQLPLDLFIKIKKAQGEEACLIHLDTIKWDKNLQGREKKEIEALATQGRLTVAIDFKADEDEFMTSKIYLNEIEAPSCSSNSAKIRGLQCGSNWSPFAHQDEGSILFDADEESIKITTNSNTPLDSKDKWGLYSLGCLASVKVLKVKPNTTYTLFGEIKTEKLTNASAFFNIEYLQELSNDSLKPSEKRWVDNRSRQLSGNHPWSQSELTFTTSENDSHVRVYLEVDHYHPKTEGSASFRKIYMLEHAFSLPFEEENQWEVAKTYDKANNLVTFSKPFKTTSSLIENPNFERAEEKNSSRLPVGWELFNHKDQGSIRLEQNEGGSHSLAIETFSSTKKPLESHEKHELGCIACTQIIPVLPLTTYTVSGLIKTESLRNAQAFFNIEFLKEGVEGDFKACKIRWIDNRHSSLKGNHDWTRRQLTFTTGEDTNAVCLFLEVDHHSSETSGVAKFRQIQLEEGAEASPFNYVENGDFQMGLENTWYLSLGNGQIDPEYQALRLCRTSRTDPNQQYKQTINIDLPKGRAISVTGLSKAYKVQNFEVNAPNNDYAIWVDAIDDLGGYHRRQVPFNLGTHDWQRVAATFTFERDIQKIYLFLLFRGDNIGVVWFDGIRLEETRAITEYGYNDQRVLEEVIDPLGNRFQFKHFDGERVDCTNPRGQQWHFYHEPLLLSEEKNKEENQFLRRLESSIPNSAKAEYEYCPITKNLIKKTIRTPEEESVSSFAFNQETGRLEKATNPLGDSIHYHYDDPKRKMVVNYSDEALLEYLLDELGRIVEEDYDGEPRFGYFYDKERVEVRDLLLNVTRKADFLKSQLKRIEIQRGEGPLEIMEWERDDQEMITGCRLLRAEGEYKFSFTYNALQQNTRVTDFKGNKHYLDYAEGFLSLLSLANGTFASYGREEGRLTSLDIVRKNGQRIASWRYRLDENGNRVTVEEQRKRGSRLERVTLNYAFDGQEQLIFERVYHSPLGKYSSYEYGYDPRGNRLLKNQFDENKQLLSSTKSKFNLMNQLIHQEVFKENSHLALCVDYSYDKRGNLCCQKSSSFDDAGNVIKEEQKNFYWDADGCLLSVTEGSGAHERRIADYQYDEEGRRISSIVNGEVTHYHYDGKKIHVLYETNALNEVTALYTYTANGQLLTVQKGEQTYYYHANARGDVIAITDEQGEIVASYSYDAWGNILESEGPFAAENPYLYAGYRFDRETGFYYLINRFYNPENGHFISVDPFLGSLEDILSQNGYSYVSNNPVMRVDLDGASHAEVRGIILGFLPGGELIDCVFKAREETLTWSDAASALVLTACPLLKYAKNAKKALALAQYLHRSRRRGANLLKNGGKVKNRVKQPPQTPKNNRKVPDSVKKQTSRTPQNSRSVKPAPRKTQASKSKGGSNKKAQNSQPGVSDAPKRSAASRQKGRSATKSETSSQTTSQVKKPSVNRQKSAYESKNQFSRTQKTQKSPEKNLSPSLKRALIGVEASIALPTFLSYFMNDHQEEWRANYRQFGRKFSQQLANNPSSSFFHDWIHRVAEECSEDDIVADEAKNRTPLTNFRIGFVNGINTRKTECFGIGKILSADFGNVPIHCILNPSNALVSDVIKSVNRLNGASSKTQKMLIDEWTKFEKKFSGDKKARYYQFCHSAGAIEVHNALSAVEKKIRDKVVVYAFAPAKPIDEKLCHKATNWVSSKDGVPLVELAFEIAKEASIPGLLAIASKDRAPLPELAFEIVKEASIPRTTKAITVPLSMIKPILKLKKVIRVESQYDGFDHSISSKTFNPIRKACMDQIKKNHGVVVLD